MELFTRTTRRVELTSYGQTFLPYARTIARTEFEGTSAVKRLQNTENGLLTIASIPSMPQFQITMFIDQFQQFYPNTTVRITEDDSNNLLEYLLNGTCELIFTREDKLTFEKNFMTNNQIIHIPYIKEGSLIICPTQINVPWKTIPVSPEINSQISLCYRTDNPLSNPAQNFVDFCTSKLFGLG